MYILDGGYTFNLASVQSVILIDEILMELSQRLHDQSRLTSINLQTSIKYHVLVIKSMDYDKKKLVLQ
jgi:hypothetical protein